MKLCLTGTGNAGQVPVYGCQCRICLKALRDDSFRRRPCSAVLQWEDKQILIDAGLPDLTERFPPGSLLAILLTHFHMDHVAGLFHLRWGTSVSIDVYHPLDEKGCDDLFRHSGILNFHVLDQPFQSFELAGMNITPLPLRHSKPTQGYVFEYGKQTLAYLTDTCGLSPEVTGFLRDMSPEVLLLDCTHPPGVTKKNHNDLTMALELILSISPAQAWLTHISHELDCYLLDQPRLPAGVYIARDNQTISLS